MSDEQTYPEVVAEAVETLIDEMRDEFKDGKTGEALRECLSERMPEHCDGHSGVIYTHYAKKIVCESRNSGAYSENFGAEGVTDRDGELNWSMMAFCALEADIYEELDRRDFDVNDPAAYFEALAENATKESP